MKTNHKIRILFLSVISVLILFLLGYQYIRNREISIYLKSKYLSDEKVIDRVLDLKAASFLKPTIDNSAWDGTVDFIKSRDKAWADENLMAVRKTFDMDFIGVYDEKGKNVYSIADTLNNLLSISEKDIQEWFKDNKVVHTYLKQNESIYEVFAAVVVPTYDVNYTTKEKGYLISANKWDSAYISGISKLTGFDISIDQSVNKILPKTENDVEVIIRNIKDSQNTHIADLIFTKNNEFQTELSNIKMLMIFAFVVLLITILLFIYLTNKWLTKPLQDITESLVEGDLTSIQILLKQKNEFGDIANLVKKFNEQKESLLKEIKEKTEATEMYKALLKAQPDIMFVFDKEGNYLDFYTPNVKLLIDNSDKILGSNVKDYFDSDFSDRFIDILNRVSSGQKVEPFEYDLNLQNNIHTFEARFVSVDKDRILSIVRDVTSRKLAEEALKNEKNLSDAIIETLPGGFFMTDLEGNYIRRNEFSENLNKDKRKGVDEENIFQYVYEEDLQKARDAFQEAKDKGHSEVEIRFEFQKGIVKWFYISTQKLVTDNNYFFIGTSIETTIRKQSELELIKAKEMAEESERLKTNFLANMSHELRTPMVGILGYSDLLRSELRDEEQHGMADKIFQSGNRLMETLNLILDLSRIEAGKLETNYSVFDISRSIETAISLYIKVIESKGLKINYENSGSKMLVNLDERMVRDILNNIINNAIKYTNSGSINISSNAVFINGTPYIAIEIKDTGIGIPADKLEIIFEEFRQVSEGLSRGFEGTGLGLSLTKKFVEKMNGFINVESELGKGSMFRITLPINIDKSKILENKLLESDVLSQVNPDIIDKKKSTEKDLKRKILVVDNDDTTLMLISAFINQYYSYDTAKSGKEAVNLAQLNKYDLILMDINLGKNDDGLSVTKLIKKIQGFKDVPVIAVTAYAMRGDKEKFIIGGCSDYLSKPFLQSDLLKVIDKALK